MVVRGLYFLFEERIKSAFLVPKKFHQVSYLAIYIYLESVDFTKGP